MDPPRITPPKTTKNHMLNTCSILARIMSFKISGISTSTKMYLSPNFYRIIMGGGCVIPNFGVLQMAGSCARARTKRFPGKSRDYENGGKLVASPAILTIPTADPHRPYQNESLR